jgi:hypothetical protein
MLAAKPHYAKHFTELEEEMEDRQAFDDLHTKHTDRVSSIFRSHIGNESTNLGSVFGYDQVFQHYKDNP